MATTRWRRAVLAGALAALAPSTARADLTEERTAAGDRLPAGISELRRDPAISGGVSVSALSLSLAMELAKPWVAPARCAWCDRDASGVSAVGALDARTRRALVWQKSGVAGTISDVVALVVVPGVSYGGIAWASTRDDAGSAFPIDALVVLEASALAVAATQVVKVAAGRQRPFAHARDEAAKDRGEPVPSPAPDENLSFPSGHTSLTMALATAAGTVATMRGYRGAPLVWATGVPLSLATGWLRIGADRHYLTDVIGGAILGAACGVLVPLVFHPPR